MERLPNVLTKEKLPAFSTCRPRSAGTFVFLGQTAKNKANPFAESTPFEHLSRISRKDAS